MNIVKSKQEIFNLRGIDLEKEEDAVRFVPSNSLKENLYYSTNLAFDN